MSTQYITKYYSSYNGTYDYNDRFTDTNIDAQSLVLSAAQPDPLIVDQLLDVRLRGVGFFLGIAGTAFAVGIPFVNAWYPPARRGFATGVFGAGMGGTALSAFFARGGPGPL